MTVTRKVVLEKLRDYFQGRLALAQLVDWAESGMMESDFEEPYAEELKDVTARLGLADAKNFGLTWDDCQEMLQKLGYSAQVEIAPIEPMLKVAEDPIPYNKKK